MGYTEADRARICAEPPKRAVVAAGAAEPRGHFERDRARVLHSAALRRLAGKTQVVGPEEGDVPRTRLTHSLEVAQIGRGIAAALGADPDVVDTAGLAHDIGHPPFGHNGERALDEAAGPCGGFEGNAQTLRILTRLEPKVLDGRGRSHGLNLTRAGLDAATKYPWQRGGDAGGDGRKYGVYPSDLDTFEWVRRGAPSRGRCIEAQIMDWADDVAYSVHDVEDGIIAGRISLAALSDDTEVAGVAELATEHYGTGSGAHVSDAAAELLRLPAVADVAGAGYDGSLTAQVMLKRLTSELVGRFVSAPVAATREQHGDRRLCRYEADLVVPPLVAAEVALLKAVALRYVMSDPERRARQAAQRTMLTELLAALGAGAPRTLDRVFVPAFEEAGDEPARLRVLIDQVASLTDAQAIAWHRGLCR